MNPISTKNKFNYGEAIREGFVHLLDNHPDVFVLGQGLWSPWYVGNTMKDLDVIYGKDRIIDTPVSEAATTGAAIGASLTGLRPIVIHPRVDFMILATDQIVNQAAKWSSMLGGQAHPAVTIRAIINRGGEQGAQHSQALHSWFAHVPGLRVVTPSSVLDARDLFIASVLSDDPVLFLEDRWLYDQVDELPASPQLTPLHELGPRISRPGEDLTIVGSGYSAYLALKVADELARSGIESEVIDLRILNPFKKDLIVKSVAKTKRLLAIDGSWETCGLGGEIIASVCESLELGTLKAKPMRLGLPHAPAPTSKPLEEAYYPTVKSVLDAIKSMNISKH